MNCLHSFTTREKHKSRKKVYQKNDFIEIVLPTQKDIALTLNHYMKSDKMPHIIYTDNESLIKQLHNCKNNPEKSSITKIGKHILCQYSMSTIWEIDHIENKQSVWWKIFFFESLRKHAKNIILKRKKMLPSIKQKLKSHQEAT